MRYTACLLLLAEARRAMTKDGIFESKLFKKLFPQQQNSVIETDCLRVVQGLSYASYLNIAMCRYHYHHLEAHLSSSDDNDSDFNLHNNSTFINISQASALALCEHAMAICPGPEVLLRKIWILERMRRFVIMTSFLTIFAFILDSDCFPTVDLPNLTKN